MAVLYMQKMVICLKFCHAVNFTLEIWVVGILLKLWYQLRNLLLVRLCTWSLVWDLHSQKTSSKLLVMECSNAGDVQYKYYSFWNSITRASQNERLADRNKPSDTATRHAGEQPGRPRYHWPRCLDTRRRPHHEIHQLLPWRICLRRGRT